MKKKIQLIELLAEDLLKNAREYIKQDALCGWKQTYMNSDYGKTALKRKITTLRRELLLLERMIDGGK